MGRLAECEYFISLDLGSGYHQIPVEETSIPKTAFVTPDEHENAIPENSQSSIGALGDLLNILAYMDDILIPSSDFQRINCFTKCIGSI